MAKNSQITTSLNENVRSSLIPSSYRLHHCFIHSLAAKRLATFFVSRISSVCFNRLYEVPGTAIIIVLFIS
jgi:hypothetical protein